ncbi:MAG: hypothetical protein ACXABV_03635 [Candidatus Thorarchaeota archaeon]
MALRRFSEPGQERGLWPCMLLTFLFLVLILLHPFTPLQISTWPIAVLFALMIVGTFFGCGSTFRGRPQFQFHYHGEHTAVLDEMGNEIKERAKS